MQSDKSDNLLGFPVKIEALGATVAPMSEVTTRIERESTRQAKERFLTIFERSGGSSVTLVSQHVGISRDTYYRWLREDVTFKNKIERVQSYILDFVEELLLVKAFQGDGPSIRFWLSHRHPDYMRGGKPYGYNQNVSQNITLADLMAKNQP
ncbi:MAG: hypothetical protein WC473_01370 [Patescibacteria group bacterium]|jgi:hypothetical protein